MNDDINVKLTQRELKLLLEYAFPFEEDKEQLLRYSKIPGRHTISIDAFNFPRLIGDLIYSSKKINDAALLEEINALCETMEREEKRTTNSVSAIQ